MGYNRTVNLRNEKDLHIWDSAFSKAEKLNLSLSWVTRQLLSMWLNGEIEIEIEPSNNELS